MDADPSSDPPTRLRGLDAREVLRRALAPPRITGGASERWEPPPVEEMARQFPGYDVLDLLGRGGMGAVYRARQLSLARLVAIKILPLELSLREEFAGRFRREAQALAQLAHPHIVGVHDFGQTPDGHLYFVMEFVEGGDLAHRMAAGPMESSRAIEIVRQICDALAAAHAAGFVHRDVKPSNVLLDSRGGVKVSDFGLTGLLEQNEADELKTVTGTVFGTPEYMAPEQADHAAIDQRADIYSVGVMFYEMLTGHLPRGVFDPPSRMSAVNPAVDAVVLRALQSEPERRFQTAREMGQELGELTPPPGPFRKWAPAFAAAIAIVVIAVLALLHPWRKEVPVQTHPETSAPKTTAAEATISASTPPPASKPAEAFINSLGQRFLPAGTAGVLFCVWETRVRDFKIFVSETGRRLEPGFYHRNETGIWLWRDFKDWREPRGYDQTPDYPVVCIGWEDATEFCRWLTKREFQKNLISPGTIYRLPHDDEWSTAAGLPANAKDDPDVFPWGKDFPPPKDTGNFAGDEMRDLGWLEKFPVIIGYQDGYTGPSPVGVFHAERHGLFDLGGNVAEWIADSHPERPDQRLARGGSWANGDRATLRSAHHSAWPPDHRSTARGFRIVLDRTHSSPQ